MNNMDAEQFGRLLTELQALRMEIRRFNDRFDVVSQKHGGRPSRVDQRRKILIILVSQKITAVIQLRLTRAHQNALYVEARRHPFRPHNSDCKEWR